MCGTAIGLGSCLTKFFNFQFTEVRRALTTVCFHSLSQYECVQFLFTLPNIKLALPMTFNVNHNVTVDVALRWFSLGEAPHDSTSDMLTRTVCTTPGDRASCCGRLWRESNGLLFVRDLGGYFHKAPLCSYSLSSPLCFYLFWPKPPDDISISKGRRWTPDAHPAPSY